MFEGIVDPGKLADIGPVGLLVIIVLLVLFGRLIPSRTHERELIEARKRGDDWKAAHDIQDARADMQAAQIGELLELGRTMYALIRAMQDAGGVRVRRDDDGRAS